MKDSARNAQRTTKSDSNGTVHGESVRPFCDKNADQVINVGSSGFDMDFAGESLNNTFWNGVLERFTWHDNEGD